MALIRCDVWHRYVEGSGSASGSRVPLHEIRKRLRWVKNYLNLDCTKDLSPTQISYLTAQRAREIVRCCERELGTDIGTRFMSPDRPRKSSATVARVRVRVGLGVSYDHRVTNVPMIIPRSVIPVTLFNPVADDDRIRTASVMLSCST